MTLPVKRDPTDLDLGPIRLTATSVTFTAAPSLEDWQAAFQWVKRCQGAVQWWCGDLALTGDNMFGEEASQEYDKDTVRRWMWVCDKVHQEIRRKELTFSHHEAVAKLEPREQRYWLDLAVREGLSANELKRRIKADEAIPEDDSKETCPVCGKKGWSGVYAT